MLRKETELGEGGLGKVGGGGSGMGESCKGRRTGREYLGRPELSTLYPGSMGAELEAREEKRRGMEELRIG